MYYQRGHKKGDKMIPDGVKHCHIVQCTMETEVVDDQMGPDDRIYWSLENIISL